MPSSAGGRAGVSAVLRHAEMVELDRRAQDEFGIPEASLIESAGIQAQDQIDGRRWTRRGGERDAQRAPLHGAVYVVGRGNNGADALVMARHAYARGARGIHVLQLGPPPMAGTPAAIQLEATRRLRLTVHSVTEGGRSLGAAGEALQSAPVVVDGICGTGIRGSLRGVHATVVTAVNGCGAPVVAVDVPSGMNDDGDGICIRAELTLAMGAAKRCVYLPRNRLAAGEVVVLDCGFPPELLQPDDARGRLIAADALPAILPAIRDDAHKGVRGHAALLGGSRGTAGAVRLAAEAAGRVGAGLVTVLTDHDVAASMAPSLPSAMWRPLPGNAAADELRNTLGRCDAVGVGPGWGTDDGRLALLRALLDAVTKPTATTCERGIIDADGLNLLARLRSDEGTPRNLRGRWVLTPHPAELARLSQCEVADVLRAPDESAARAAADWNATVVLKGHVTVISEQGADTFVDRPNAALATGGSGDVLAGAIVSLLAIGLPPSLAAQGGVLLHAEAARLARREKGWFLAEELPPYLGRCAERAAASALASLEDARFAAQPRYGAVPI